MTRRVRSRLGAVVSTAWFASFSWEFPASFWESSSFVLPRVTTTTGLKTRECRSLRTTLSFIQFTCLNFFLLRYQLRGLRARKHRGVLRLDQVRLRHRRRLSFAGGLGGRKRNVQHDWNCFDHLLSPLFDRRCCPHHPHVYEFVQEKQPRRNDPHAQWRSGKLLSCNVVTSYTVNLGEIFCKVYLCKGVNYSSLVVGRHFIPDATRRIPATDRSLPATTDRSLPTATTRRLRSVPTSTSALPDW